ncbi:hypothetical protein [Clostridium sp. SM-530-WT-3G]|uniref:hypothetical protein n=1 Tax=Clostridium sp. SM-530-WT-3G TaxID=2725303 RepID=UPI00145C80B8|nr:hypothetical protein [Clostridium sp. SM-530-WT-3G]NME82509.1 hypothetical protein [Clostridium sp. SM-530-WT-3G]
MYEKSVKENLSTMNFKEKFSYLLYYYKFHLIGILIAVLVVGSFIYSEINKKDIYLNVAYIGSSISTETYEDVSNNLNASLLPDNESSIVEFNIYDLSNTATLTKFQASLAAKELDLAIVNKNFFNENYENEFFLDLNSIDNFSSLNIDENALIKKDNNIYGIKIDNLKIFNELNTPNSNNFLVVISNSKNSTKLIDLLNACGIN